MHLYVCMAKWWLLFIFMLSILSCHIDINRKLIPLAYLIFSATVYVGNIFQLILVIIGPCLSITSDSIQLQLFNLLMRNANYSGHTAPLTSKVAFYIFIQQI